MWVASYIMSTAALCLYSSSYFFKRKRNYLILQLTGNVCLSLSYLFMGAFFTMVSALIGVARGLICYLYEKKDKQVPIPVVAAICLSIISSYAVINLVILSDPSPWDLLYLVASCLYAVTFTIRNIKVMRYAVLVPHSFAVAYNLLARAPISSAISYGIELAVTVAAIIRFAVGERRARQRN